MPQVQHTDLLKALETAIGPGLCILGDGTSDHLFEIGGDNQPGTVPVYVIDPLVERRAVKSICLRSI